MASLQAEKIFELGPIPVTNSLITAIIVTTLIIIISLIYYKKSSLIPNKFTALVETGVEFLYTSIENIAGKKTMQFFPLCATFFILILFNSWFGLLPFVGPVGINKIVDGKTELIPLFRSINADINGTAILALISVFMTHFFAIRSVGVLNHIGRYIPFFNLRFSDFTSPSKIIRTIGSTLLNLFIGILELVSEFVKIISLSFRLFGNIYAGEIALSTIAGLLAFIAPLPFLGLEIIAGYVQATVFMLLTVVFMTILSEKHGVENHNVDSDEVKASLHAK